MKISLKLQAMLLQMKTVEKGTADYDEAFGDFYLASCSYLRNIVNKCVHKENDSEDILQEVYVKLFRYAHSYEEGKSLYGWLSMIVNNAKNDYYRSEKKAQKQSISMVSSDDDDAFILLSDEKENEEAWAIKMDDKAALKALEDVLIKLSQRGNTEQERERSRKMVLSFQLKYFHNMEIKQVAAALGISEASATNWIFRTRDRIKKELNSLK
ncbi:sigma-70 family RNA polymerase sigma factor [Christensenellaceae bacterium OttesenSCG-928-M15]|nr:sigma-70 family RNA polymerase sigma factor [Christensenellaceae bacterium OttesenSCG-928-M15]